MSDNQLVEEQSGIEKYRFEKSLETLREYQGSGTQLISLYIPKTKAISDVRLYLRNEVGESSNIKSKSTRNNVIEGIESALQALKDVEDRDIPETGIAIFSGHVDIGGQRTKKIKIVVHPPMKIGFFSYRCSSSFEIQELEKMSVSTEIYGIILIDRQEAAIGYLQGTSLVKVSEFESDVPRKTRRGGQSSSRFYRRRELLAHYFFVRVAEHAREEFCNNRRVKGILIGGPGDTKKIFYRKNYIGTDLTEKVLKVCDVGYSTFLGMRDIIAVGAEMMENSPYIREKNLIERFQRGIAINKGVFYGLHESIERMINGEAEHILISKEINLVFRTTRCKYCSSVEEQFINPNIIKENLAASEDSEVEASENQCAACGIKINEENIQDQDLVDYVVFLSESHGTALTIISTDTEEGVSFLRVFGGIGGFTRF